VKVRAAPTEAAASTRLGRAPWRCAHLGFQDQSFGVHEQVALPAPHLLLVFVVSSLFAARPGSLGRLRVDDARARSKFSTRTGLQQLAQGGVEPLEGPIEAPLPEPVVDAFPRREVFRQQPPRAASL
jgi:hypothetical protein